VLRFFGVFFFLVSKADNGFSQKNFLSICLNILIFPRLVELDLFHDAEVFTLEIVFIFKALPAL